AWVSGTVVDLPDAVGHPAFPSTMEALVGSRGTLLEAARAALEMPDVLAEARVERPRLAVPIIPTSVRTVPSASGALPKPAGGGDPREELEIACVIGRGGQALSILEASEAIFGYALVTATRLAPTIVTADELDRSNPRLVMTVEGEPFLEAAFDAARLAAIIARTSRDDDLQPGDLFVFHTEPAVVVGQRRRRVRSDSL